MSAIYSRTSASVSRAGASEVFRELGSCESRGVSGGESAERVLGAIPADGKETNKTGRHAAVGTASRTCA
jgi:hypothetical protein